MKSKLKLKVGSTKTLFVQPKRRFRKRISLLKQVYLWSLTNKEQP
ncbi:MULTISPECIES: hypothetical protein [Vibrio]|uniref:Uncharacterized protein n=1 Tax=Vibrio cortegadensis TaxID=1328770 RepID=A0ABV4M4V6_9VIBR|nr:hypothetical protein [Vibrio genomosp. F6]